MDNPLRCCDLTCDAPAEWLLTDGIKPKHDDYTHACTAHVGALLTNAAQTVVTPLGTAFRTVLKHTDDGRQYIDLEAYTCDAAGHSYGGLISRGPRAGLPKINGRCICGAQCWNAQREAEFQVAKAEGRVVDQRVSA